MKKIRKMGSFKQILAMLPGVPKEIRDAEFDEKQLYKIDAIITSMTKKERKNPKILDASRRKRIAKGSGTKVEDINKFMNSFSQMQKMMKQMSNGKGMLGGMKFPKF
ncbi:Signal recognition particle protein [compost metagenome]